MFCHIEPYMCQILFILLQIDLLADDKNWTEIMYAMPNVNLSLCV